MTGALPDRAAVEAVLSQAGIAPSSPIEPVPHPGNNRVFRVIGDPPALLKWYFAHPDDPRDRLGAEISFSRFAWRRGLRALPQPRAADATSRLAVYEWLPGRPPSSAGESEVGQAGAFVRELNAHRDHSEAGELPTASEACFSVNEHLRLVGSRLDRLARLGRVPGAREAAHAFSRQELLPAAQETLAAVRRDAGEDAERLLDLSERIVSPSDFGLHNALVDDAGVVRFFDFEYAGWDDPAKMACDFFCQPRVPVPLSAWRRFADAAELGDDARRRAALLLPVYRLKWCCILLSDFLPEGGARRSFAGGDAPDESRLWGQLDKARLALRDALGGSRMEAGR